MGQNRSARRKADKLKAEKLKRQHLWGLWDTKDNLWIGDDAGPRKFEDEMMAKIAARVYDYQVGWPAGRIRVKPFTSSGKKRDEVPVKISALKALQNLESGRVI